jgi:hypothetical protein
MPVFQPLTHRLLIGGGSGLRDFPLPFVVYLVDDVLFRIGIMINSYEAESERWDRRKLVENLVTLVASVIPEDPTNRYVRWSAIQGKVSPAAVAAPAPKPPPGEKALRVKKPPAVRPAARSSPAPNTPARPPAVVVRTDKQGVCHANLISHFGLGGPCTRPACIFNHVVSDYSKTELLAAVAKLTRGDSSALVAKIHSM